MTSTMTYDDVLLIIVDVDVDVDVDDDEEEEYAIFRNRSLCQRARRCSSKLCVCVSMQLSCSSDVSQERNVALRGAYVA